LSKEIIVHSLDHALAAFAAADAAKVPLTLASARGAAAQAGPAWFKALIEAARAAYPGVVATAILDCGDEPGMVMAALRLGLTRLRFGGSEPLRAKLTAMGAAFVAEPASSAQLDLLDTREPKVLCRAFLDER
jgi:hypothetical protein